jgi:hypothetical protein
MTHLAPVRLRRAAGVLAAALLVLTATETPALAFGRTLDEVFRGVLREEHDGTLPPFVVNRGPVPYPERKPLTPEQAAEQARTADGLKPRDLGEEPAWVEVVGQVAGGRPSPFAVEVVRRKAEEGDAQAIELLAWMSANGVGVQRDLPRAFDLYSRANGLGVDGAKDNAEAIYRSMSAGERRTVFNPF